MTITKERGYIVIMDVIKNQLITRKFSGYTLREAKAKFKKIVKN